MTAPGLLDRRREIPMDSISYSNLGVPIWSAESIESTVHEILLEKLPRVLRSPVLTNVAELLALYGTSHGLLFEISPALGLTDGGRRLLGSFVLSPPTIRIDASLMNDVRFPFTIAHEVGHFILHGDLKLDAAAYAAEEFNDAEFDLTTGRKKLQTAREWLEWQANRFAAALVVPRATFTRAIVEAQNAMGITQNLGRVHVESKRYSLQDFRELLKRLAVVYNVSENVIEYRLSELELLVDRRTGGIAGSFGDLK